MRTSETSVGTLLAFLVLCPSLGLAAAPRKTTAERQEENLFKSLLNCPLCKGKEAIACFKRTRYEEGKTWKECLDECIENSLIRSTFLALLPADTPKKDEINAGDPSLEDVSLKHATVGLSTHSEL
mmetsp:Transcript_68558/g.107180  ORF Transcript_68558/g.107180 Transcript_68558/m.107180 type:complete len:126 (+) Transcript_68558:86-463(+)|eukprot:CAMPEP_0169073162 /NCGR_PEP_ID=MMETSP1015-20121227/6592_1 /TAXON_ID=342587 /ORGANISM="Karlodinium micrum, Strain CCMP2283" /LENGTH=125 /DNA_ID=CAMNT_0009132389 /DNA_START=82 /DNA_END=459 /DNA_ORIENTATION=+